MGVKPRLRRTPYQLHDCITTPQISSLPLFPHFSEQNKVLGFAVVPSGLIGLYILDNR